MHAENSYVLALFLLKTSSTTSKNVFNQNEIFNFRTLAKIRFWSVRQTNRLMQ